MRSTEASTRERLLTVAERLLPESGYDAVSVRDQQRGRTGPSRAGSKTSVLIPPTRP